MSAPIRLLLPLLVLAALVGCTAAAGPSTGIPPGDAGPRPLAVGLLLVDGVYNTELTAPYDVFQHSIFHTEPGMDVFTVAASLEPVTSFEGLRLLPDHTFADAPHLDVLVVPSAEHSMDTDLEDAALMEYVARAGADADWVVSLCDGAFVLAGAGLLDGLRSTTFPSDVGRYRERYPHLDVVEDVSFVHDGKAITSAGGARSFDASLYLAELLWGADVARGIAGGLVIDWDVDAIPHLVAPGALRPAADVPPDRPRPTSPPPSGTPSPGGAP